MSYLCPDLCLYFSIFPSSGVLFVNYNIAKPGTKMQVENCKRMVRSSSYFLMETKEGNGMMNGGMEEGGRHSRNLAQTTRRTPKASGHPGNPVVYSTYTYTADQATRTLRDHSLNHSIQGQMKLMPCSYPQKKGLSG